MVGGEWGQGKWKLSANLQHKDKYVVSDRICSSPTNKYSSFISISWWCFAVLFKNNVTGNNWLLVITQCWYLLHDETEIVSGMWGQCTGPGIWEHGMCGAWHMVPGPQNRHLPHAALITSSYLHSTLHNCSLTTSRLYVGWHWVVTRTTFEETLPSFELSSRHLL